MKTFLRSPDRDVKQLIYQLPLFFNNFLEPFLSSGDIFFNLFNHGRVFKKAFLSSSNSDLVRAYTAVKDEPERVQRMVTAFCENNSKAFFENMKHAVSSPSAFIYVNRAMSPDGKWRESQFIDRNKEISKDVETIDRCSRYLNRWCQSVRNCDWERTLTGANEGDVVWLEPPLLAATIDGRVDYVTNGFNESNHVYLRNFVVQLWAKRVKIFMIQSDTKATERIYGEPRSKLENGQLLYEW